MSLLPSSWLLRRLRRVVIDDDDAALRATCSISREVACRLRGLRSKFQHAVREADTLAEGTEAFLDTWRVFSTLPANHALYLHPLFETPELLTLIKNEANIAIRLDQVQAGRGPGVPGTGHRVIGGALGVGKTYFLRGMSLVLATVCDATTPITLNYEALGAISQAAADARAALVPLSVILDAHELFENSGSPDECAAELCRRSSAIADEDVPCHADAVAGTKLSQAHLLPVLLLDEVNTWYRAEGDPMLLRGSKLVQQLFHFSRRPHVHAVVAGSSSCLREQIFALESWSGRGYPSLNGTLFAYVYIQPLRDVALLTRYLSATGLTLPADMSIGELLSLSGGVGRVIADVLLGMRDTRARKDPVDLFLSDPLFAVLAVHILTTPENEAALEAEWPPPMGLAKTAVLAFLRDLGHGADALRKLEGWIDVGVLYMTQAGGVGASSPRIEFLFPHHARVLRAFTSGSARLINNVRIQLQGVEGSLGNALESLCRPQLASLFAGSRQLAESLVMRARVAKTSHETRGERPFAPLDMLGQVICWADQVGIEDFVLDRDAEDRSIVWVDGWQCKSPKAGSEMRAGTPALASVVAAKGLPPSLDPIKYLSHASAKACWGMCTLLAILTHAAADSDVAFRPRTVFLRTTAVLDVPAQAAAQAPVALDAAVIAAFNASTKSERLGCKCPAEAAGYAFSWSVLDGVEWTDALLPADSRGQLTYPELLHRTAVTREAVAARAPLAIGEDGAAR